MAHAATDVGIMENPAENPANCFGPCITHVDRAGNVIEDNITAEIAKCCIGRSTTTICANDPIIIMAVAVGH